MWVQANTRKSSNITQHTLDIFIRVLEKSGVTVNRGPQATELTLMDPHGNRFRFSLMMLGRCGHMLVKVYRPDDVRRHFEKPFFSWATISVRKKISAKRAAVLLAKKIQLNPLYTVMES